MQKQPLHNTIVSSPIAIKRSALSFRTDFMQLGYSQIQEDLEAAIQPWGVGACHGFCAMEPVSWNFLATKKMNS